MSAATASAPAGVGVDRLARFRLLRELGRGAQARVMLAHDPRLDREVALKLLNRDADAAAVGEWLNEARAVSRLAHPNIVPLFEADAHDGQSYLVFEYVEGPTLAQARSGKGPMPARDAVQLLLGVLDALAAAHAQGVVHRDLKPSNILLGKDGRARVMDFGIAARVGGSKADSDGSIVGTPGYMSPEAARGEPPVPAMDVFSAGVMLAELLAGGPLLRETDPHRAVQRIQAEDMVLPAHTRIDEALRGIVQRALARDAAARYDGAAALHAALQAWLQPADGADAGDDSPAVLDFLLRRMRHKTDFPALSASVVRIQRLATSETESLQTLADELLKDVALTNKLLRMVNTVHFTSVAGGGVGTVSRAVALVGFAGIRNMALSVVLLEHMGDKAHAAQLKEEFLRALLAGTLAEELSLPVAGTRDGEEAFLGALFQNLGRLLTECYLPDEAVQVRQHLGPGVIAAAQREAVARKVLGLGFDALGAGVAKAWGLPDALQRALRPPPGDAPAKAIDRRADHGVERVRWAGRGANEMADALLHSERAEQLRALGSVAQHYAPALGLSAREVLSAAQSARTKLATLASAMGLHVAPGAPARRLLPTVEGFQIDDARPAERGTATVDAATLVMPRPPSAPDAAAAAAVAAVAAGQTTCQQQLAQALATLKTATPSRAMRVDQVLPLVLGTMHRAAGFGRVVFCLREAGGGALAGRLALGSGADALRAAFRFVPDGTARNDLFAWVAARGADLLVSDSKAVAARLPAWYRRHVDAPTFLLLPVKLKAAPLGLIYADKGGAGSIVLGETDLALLRGLRDQIAAAMARSLP